MKIKRRKYLSEKEALHWLVDNSETLLGIEFEKNAYGDKFFGCDFRYDERLDKTENGSYYITEEVEITEETKIPLIVAMNRDMVDRYANWSIQNLLDRDKKFGIDYKNIYILNDNGSIGELIWSKERGLID